MRGVVGTPHIPERLEAVLTEAQRRGFLGPGPVTDHVVHADAFVRAWYRVATSPPRTLVDLGTGGGIPGLVLAVHWPETEILLVDGSVRRIEWVTEAVDHLHLGPRARAVAVRAEEAGARFRHWADLVVARGFGPAAVTAECGAPLVAPEGWLAVSEPPDHRPDRWPPARLAELGLELGPRVGDPAHVQLLRAAHPAPARYPRRIGLPAKRPLWPEPGPAGAPLPD